MVSGERPPNESLAAIMKTYINDDGIEMYIPIFDMSWPEEYMRTSYVKHDRVRLLQVSVVVLTTLSVIAVIGRLVARRQTKAKLGWDDYTIFIGMVSSLGGPAQPPLC